MKRVEVEEVFNVAGVHGSVTGIQNKSATEGMEKSGHRSVTRAWLDD